MKKENKQKKVNKEETVEMKKMRDKAKKVKTLRSLIGYNSVVDGVSSHIYTEQTFVKDIECTNAVNPRFDDDKIGFGDTSIDERVDGNSNTSMYIISKGIKKHSHVKVIPSNMVSKVHEITKEIIGYDEGFFDYRGYSKEKKDIDIDEKNINQCLKESDKKFVIMDGYTTCACVLSAKYITDSYEKDLKERDESLFEISKYYDKEKISVGVIEDGFLDGESSLTRDLRWLEVVSVFVEANMSSWRPKIRDNFIYTLIRFTDLIVYKHFKDRKNYSFSFHDKVVSAIYEVLMPTITESKKKSYTSSSFCPALILARYSYNPDEFKFKECANEIVAEIGAQEVKKLRRLYEILYYLNLEGVTGLAMGQRLMVYFIRYTSKLSCKLSEVYTNRDRISKLDMDAAYEELSSLSDFLKDSRNYFKTDMDVLLNGKFDDLTMKLKQNLKQVKDIESANAVDVDKYFELRKNDVLKFLSTDIGMEYLKEVSCIKKGKM